MHQFGRTLSQAFLAAALALLCQCASGPQLERFLSLGPGHRATVAYQTPHLSLSMVNASALDKAQAKRARQADANLKIIPDREVQLLLDVLAALDFFEMASAEGDPEASTQVVVAYDNTTYVVTNRVPDREGVVRFHKFIAAFNDVYNSTDDFRGSDMTARDLERSGQDLNQSSETIRAKKRGKTKQP